MAQSTLNTPMLWINTYVKEKLDEKLINVFPSGIPFFPTSPSTIDNITQAVAEDQNAYAVYDRMFRMRTSPFPHVKTEQVIYYFYTGGENPSVNMIQVQELIMRLMDREDETAEEINAWALAKGSITVEGQPIEPNYYFHTFKVFHLEEARDIVDFGTARTFAGNKFIIQYEYHYVDIDTA